MAAPRRRPPSPPGAAAEGRKEEAPTPSSERGLRAAPSAATAEADDCEASPKVSGPRTSQRVVHGELFGTVVAPQVTNCQQAQEKPIKDLGSLEA
mmetsp:Transcript_7183/g.26195  ORF Transcript_7183/g.26195 Transcript_7183/m.26195 type:complete len:95 (+) Transcript_7183:180-464(+)